MPMPGVRGAPCAVGTGTDRRVWMWGCGGGVRGDTHTARGRRPDLWRIPIREYYIALLQALTSAVCRVGLGGRQGVDREARGVINARVYRTRDSGDWRRI